MSATAAPMTAMPTPSPKIRRWAMAAVVATGLILLAPGCPGPGDPGYLRQSNPAPTQHIGR